jgi:hypothetical protein
MSILIFLVALLKVLRTSRGSELSYPENDDDFNGSGHT